LFFRKFGKKQWIGVLEMKYLFGIDGIVIWCTKSLMKGITTDILFYTHCIKDLFYYQINRKKERKKENKRVIYKHLKKKKNT
jgi:hypothetical protein